MHVHETNAANKLPQNSILRARVRTRQALSVDGADGNIRKCGTQLQRTLNIKATITNVGMLKVARIIIVQLENQHENTTL